VFASSGDFDGTTLMTPRVYGRIEMAITDVIDVLVARAQVRRGRMWEREVRVAY